MSFNAQFVRFIPFVVDEENTKSNDALLDPFVFSKWSISKSSGLWFDMELLEKKFDKDGIDARSYPILVGISSPTRGTKEIMDSSKNIQININYLATVVFGLIYTSREIQSGENKIQVSEFISGITNFLDGLINMNIDEDDLLTLSAMLESAHLMLKEIAPIQYTEFNSLLSDVDVTDSNGETISFKLISDIDLVMEQSIYLYDSKIGFVVNQITIERLKHLDQEIIYSMDLMFRLCSGGLSWNVEVPQKILAEINENVDIITVSKLNRIQTYYDVIVYDETIPISGLDEKSLIDNPIIEILETPLRGNLYLVNIKEAKKLISQAEFRTSLKNSGFFREKIPIMKTMNFIFLQMFHEKTQTRQYLDIYRKIWEGWHHELTKALSWSTGQIVKGGMTQLSSIYSDASRLELFFAGQFADMNLQVKLEELSKTLLYHLYLTSLSGSSISILIDDLDLETSEIKLEKLKILTEESSFLEYIDPKLFMNSMAEKIDLETEYSSFRELHENLEKMLQSVQDISQTKQQRWITIALVVFSVTEMTLAFLEVFK